MIIVEFLTNNISSNPSSELPHRGGSDGGSQYLYASVQHRALDKRKYLVIIKDNFVNSA